MSIQDFATFFKTATNKDPFPYQASLAESQAFPELVRVPTGAGKTAAAVVAWLYRRRFHPSPEVRAATPRRLVYCLPMRVLVEQTLGKAREWLQEAGLAQEVEVRQLMGGAVERDWVRSPERDAILVGTMDMLLSRALNRGFAASRFRWPIEFSLLNNDAQWVLDEIQLMDAGLVTSIQLQAFRDAFGVALPCRSLWMSATAAAEWLATVDRQLPPAVVELLPEDRKHPELDRRLGARKTVTHLEDRGSENILGALLEAHLPSTTTLAVVNTVHRAVDLYRRFEKRLNGRPNAPELVLVHSRFRPPDRRRKNDLLTEQAPPGGRIVVSTQVIEAGVDLSAATLLTEVAPWGSVVQRLGRCNRFGEYTDAQVYWVDVEESHPYEADDLDRSRRLLERLEGSSASPASLEAFGPGPPPGAGETLRRRDLIELFDTEPDLGGNDVDVSRFIRSDADADLQVFWRHWDGKIPPAELAAPTREELCPVPIWELRKLLEKRRRGMDPASSGWVWDHLDRAWCRVQERDLRPGQVVLLAASGGGYEEATGWDPASAAPVPFLPGADRPEEAVADDPLHETGGQWVPLADHLRRTRGEAESLWRALDPDLSGWTRAAVLDAVLWHDLGKAHPVFQKALLALAPEEERAVRAKEVWAKSGVPGRLDYAKQGRPHFRHELASALAVLAAWRPAAGDKGGVRDLAAYLVAAHHGKVRLAIRSLPGEREPEDQPGARFARGVWEGDQIGPFKVDGLPLQEVELSLQCMELGAGPDGEPSWAERCLRLLDDLGPFRLAFLETLVCLADWRTSESEAGHHA